ncbi:MAG: hypothetical protein PHP50_06270 [Lachnospiraceae bacterium]|nr:hypothetical protein [Lachnospiraceae bacterium]
MKKQKLTTKELVLMGILVAVLEASKMALAFLPNVELVSFFIILYTVIFGNWIWPILVVFLALEGLLNGFGLWWIMYAYVWPLLALAAFLCRKQKSTWFYSVLSGFFGLFFGGLCSFTYLFFGGVRTAFAWWIAGISYDLIHCVSNFILCLLLFRPLQRALLQCRSLFKENL